MQVGRRFDAAQFRERGEDVDQRDGRFRDPAGLRHAGGHDQQRDAGAFLEQAHLLPQAVLAHVIAVIAGEDDDRVLGEPQAIQRVHHPADLRIHELMLAL